MIKDNRNNEQIYGRNDMIMLDLNNKIYGSLGLADNYVMKTEEGTRLVLNNPKQGRFGDVLTEFNIYGRSEQKQYSGKNLLKIRDGVQTERGVTVIAKDGVVALKGTATETGWTTLKTDSFILNGMYILSSNLTDVTIRLANKSYKAVISQNESKTLENEEVSVLCFVVKEGITYDVSNILVQIEKGSKATSYEPYVGGQPSPSPDYPQEIKSVVNPIVKVTNEDGTQFETVTLPYTLNAIPVASGGNVTIDGQQYIADRVVEKEGVFGIERNTAIDVPVLTEKLIETPDNKGRFIQNGAFKKTFTPSYAPLVNIGYGKIWGIVGSVIDKWIFGVNKLNLYISPPKDLNYTSEDILNALKDLDIKVYGVLLVPFFEPFTGDIQAKLRALVTYYPVTIIENNYNTWMKATYKSIESV